MHVFSDVRVWIGSFLVMWVSLFITYSKLVRARAKVKLYKDFLELREAQIRRLRAMKNEDNVLWEREWRAAKADMAALDKCDVCKNSSSDEKYFDTEDGEEYPRRYKCASCFLGGGEHNNFDWRGPNAEKGYLK